MPELGERERQEGQALFWAFCAVMGLSLASIFLVFTGTSIARTFFIAAAMFGATSLYGYTTRRDLSSIGSFLIMGLIGVVIASLVNLFIASSALQFVVSVVGIIVFVGLTAWHTQSIKRAVCRDFCRRDEAEVGRLRSVLALPKLDKHFSFAPKFHGRTRGAIFSAQRKCQKNDNEVKQMHSRMHCGRSHTKRRAMAKKHKRPSITTVDLVAEYFDQRDEQVMQALVTAGAFVALADGRVKDIERDELLSYVDAQDLVPTIAQQEIVVAFDNRVREIEDRGSANVIVDAFRPLVGRSPSSFLVRVRSAGMRTWIWPTKSVVSVTIIVQDFCNGACRWRWHVPCC
jgi:tellurite resistance protein